MASHIERRKFLATLGGAAAWPIDCWQWPANDRFRNPGHHIVLAGRTRG
jgi:hypothetical protein